MLGRNYDKNKKTEEISLESVLWNYRVILRGFWNTEKNIDVAIGLFFKSLLGSNLRKEDSKLVKNT